MKKISLLVLALVGIVAISLAAANISHACETDSDCVQSTGLPASTCVVSSGQCSIPSIGYTCENNACVPGYNNGQSLSSCQASCGNSGGSGGSGTGTGGGGNPNQDSVNSCSAPPTYSSAAGLWTCNYCFSNGSQGTQCRPIYPCALNGGCNDGPNSGAIGGEYENQSSAQAAATRDGCSGVQKVGLGTGLTRPDGLSYYWIATDCPGQNNGGSGGGGNGGGGGGGGGGTGGGGSVSAVIRSIQSGVLNYRATHPLAVDAGGTGNSGSSQGQTQGLLTALQQSLQLIQAALTTTQGSLSQDLISAISNILTTMAQLIQTLQTTGTTSGGTTGGGNGGGSGTTGGGGNTTAARQGSLLINNAASGAFSVGQSWNLTLSGGLPTAVFNICAIHPDGGQSCSPARDFSGASPNTDQNGGWTLSGSFNVSDLGSWDEWACFGTVTDCNLKSANTSVSSHITFTVGQAVVQAARTIPTCTFAATPGAIHEGATSTFSWSCQNVLSCAIGRIYQGFEQYSPGLQLPMPKISGSTSASQGGSDETVAVATSTTFVLHCTNAAPLDAIQTTTVMTFPTSSAWIYGKAMSCGGAAPGVLPNGQQQAGGGCSPNAGVAITVKSVLAVDSNGNPTSVQNATTTGADVAGNYRVSLSPGNYQVCAPIAGCSAVLSLRANALMQENVIMPLP